MKYVSVGVETLASLDTTLTFPLFLLLHDGKYVQVFKEGDEIDRERLTQYTDKGVTKLYFRKNDRRLFVDCLLKNLTEDKEKTDLKPLRELAIRVMDDIFEYGRPEPGSVRWLKKVTETFSEVFLMEAKGIGSFMDFDESESYLSQQAVMTMVFTIAIGVSLGIKDVRALGVLGAGALLHDIGMAQLNVKPHELDRKLRDEEWSEIKQHPVLGVTVLLNTNSINTEVGEIVYQHHERWDGSGYPRGLAGSKITLSARIVAIADSLAAMTLPGGGRPRMEWNDALEKIATINGPYDPRIATHVRSQFEIKA